MHEGRDWKSVLLIVNLISGSFACYCPHIWEPVCATDEQLYSNLCFFMCAKMNQKDLMPQPITACSAPTSASNSNSENEGGANVDYPTSGSGTSNNAAQERDPTFDSAARSHLGQAYGHGYMQPICNWSCRKTPTHPSIRICDEINGVYASDCEFYKAVCRAEYRGFLLRRVPCKRSQITPSTRRKTWL